MKKLAILISGRGSNMEAILRNVKDGFLKDVCRVELVFSNNPVAPGLEKAEKMGFHTETISSKGKKKDYYESQLLELLLSYEIDLIVLAGYMKILSPLIVDAFPNKIINIHPADTKKHKGLHGYKWAFENGLDKTKITVHYVDNTLDGGEIIAQREVDISDCETVAQAEAKGLAVEHKLYSEVIYKLCKG